MIDESQLVRAIAFVPAAPPPSGNAVFDTMFGLGVIINPGNISFVGQSLGSISGAADVATNPRISQAVFNVGGGTLTDIFTTSPSFASGVNALLGQLGIQPNTSAFFQFLTVAKTVLDPADPINYVGHLTANTLPDLLSKPDGSQAQVAKKVLVQNAFCDQTVPNPTNLLFAENISGIGPLPGQAAFTTSSKGNYQLFATGTVTLGGTGHDLPACGGNNVAHGFLLMTANAQIAAAQFLAGVPTQSSVESP
jgi:hypothetical protein